MSLPNTTIGQKVFGLIAQTIWLLAVPLAAQPQSTTNVSPVRLVVAAGRVELSPTPSTTWVLTQTGQVLRAFDRLRTGPNARASLLWSDQSIVPLGELTEIEVLPPQSHGGAAGLHLVKGILSFFHRDRPGRIRVISPGATAGIEGTEFVMEVAALGNIQRSTISVIDGRVSFSNAQATLVVTNGQHAMAEPGQAPAYTAGILAENIMQWALYYPAVLDLHDLSLAPAERDALTESLAAYQDGDLLTALAAYPTNRSGVSDSERVYHSALLLAVGQVTKTEALLDVPRSPGSGLESVVSALRTLIAAVKRAPTPARPTPRLPSELLAASYDEQSRTQTKGSLERALDLAQQAARQSPEFSFAWARVAELEFGFGNIAQSLEALNKSLALAPKNAQALALKGFLLAAHNETRTALEWFGHALAVDSALGNAWLGRGLCRIRRGDRAGGREDLLVAAALEPQRALLRSYLGKAWGDGGDYERALHELSLAKGRDRHDPTAWLYSALLKQEQNRINEAIDDLETSQERNDNRRLYRSRFLLDEDRAVRSSSLASLYKRAGMDRVSLREATKAIAYDYSNYSAHQFLSDSFNALRDVTRFNLRYETVWFNELLLANVLSDVGGTPLSQHISQHDYAKLFEKDGLGVSSLTEYRSDGQWLELASQSGRFGDTAWAIDLDYQHNDGVRPNNELDRLELYATVKQQLSLQDSILLLTKVQDYTSGDNFQYYDPTNARPNFQFEEYQSPLALLAYHREWGPGVHTLALGGRLENDQRFSDRAETFPILVYDSAGALEALPDSDQLDVRHRTELEIFTAEVQQIFDQQKHLFLFGARWQGGDFDTTSRLTNPATETGYDPSIGDTEITEDFQRVTVYGYETLKLVDRLRLTGGVAYEWMEFPMNFRSPPIQAGEETRERFNPKAALVWEARPEATLRAAYGRSLGGVSLDESIGLEPRQLGGFNQAFRTLIPESLAGSVAGADHEVWGAAADLKFKSRTFVGLQGEQLESEVHRSVGVFHKLLALPPALDTIVPASTREHLDYRERSACISINQLIGTEWALGGQYAFTRSDLESRFPALQSLLVPTETSLSADLHRFNVFLLYQHPSGLFARTDLDYYLQTRSQALVRTNPRIVESVPDESFPQLGLQVGYRFPKQRGDITLGVLNLTDEDYRLNPVTPYNELPRERVFLARLRLRF